MRILSFLVSCFVLLPASVESQAATFEIVRPGDARLVTSQIGERVTRVRYLQKASSDTAEHESYRSTIEEHAVTTGGAPGILIVKVSETSAYHFVDSLMLRRAGLVPVWEHMQNQRATLSMTYDKGRVRLNRAVPDSAPGIIEHAYPVPVFGFNELELVLRSLPLAPGYGAILPLYSEGSDSLEMDTVRVTGVASHVEGRRAWTVRFADPVIVETYQIDVETRRITSHEVVGRRSGTHTRVVDGDR